MCAKYGIIYNGDLFTLVPEEMGDPKGWFGTVEAVKDSKKRNVQKQFLRTLENRYRDIPLISWDLFNEPSGLSDEDVNNWGLDLRAVFTEMGSERLLTVGGPFHMGDAVDYDSPHGRLPADFVNDRDKPILLQELHIDFGEPLEMELMQREVLRICTVTALRSGLMGICPWSWTRQQRLWQDAYEHHHTFPMEKWDDRLGIHTHEDGTYKPAGLFFKDFAIMMHNIDLLSYDARTRRSTTTKGEVIVVSEKADEYEHYSVHHINGDHCYAAMEADHIKWINDIVTSDSKTYLFYTSEDGFSKSNVIYVKSEDPCKLTIHRGKANDIMVVDRIPDGDKVLGDVEYHTNETTTIVETSIDICRYWIKIQF